MYRPITRKRISLEIADQITDLVIGQQLRPGDKLPTERQLTEDLNVSRTALREAIKTLEERGVVDVRQGSGTFVRAPSADSVSTPFAFFLKSDQGRYLQLYDVREMLEIDIAVRLAQGIANEEDLQNMEAHLKAMQQLLGSPAEFAREDVAFHVDFYRAMKNDVLLMMMEVILQLLGEMLELTFVAPGATEISLKRHEKLFECIRARDPEGARQVMQEVISHGRERLQETLQIEEQTVAANQETANVARLP